MKPHTLRATLLTAAAATLVLAGPRGALANFLIDFNNQNDSGLTRINPLTVTGQGGNYAFPLLSQGNFGYQLTQAGTPPNNPVGPARLGSAVTGQAFGDVRMTVDVVNFDESLGQTFGLALRFSNIGLGTTTGYVLDYVTPSGSNRAPAGNFLFDKVTGEQSVPIGTDAALTLQTGHSYRFTLEAIGSSLTGQVFDLANPNTALATVNATDTTYASGAAGLFAAAADLTPTSAVNVTFDNFVVQSVPEPSSFVLTLVGSAALGLFGLVRHQRRAAA